MMDRENYWIRELDSKTQGYNIADATFGDTLSIHPLKDQIFKKISDTIRLNNSLLSKEELRKKHGTENRLKDKTVLDVYGIEAHRNLSDKITISNINRNMGGKGNPFYGKTHTKESLEKMSKSQTGLKKPWVKVVIKGITYKNVSDAVRTSGITRKKLMSYCKDPSNPDYNLL